MTWQELLAQRKVESRRPARAELLELRALAAREISDAGTRGLSPEGKFEHAYAAARALATLVIRAEGYRVISASGGHPEFAEKVEVWLKARHPDLVD